MKPSKLLCCALLLPLVSLGHLASASDWRSGRGSYYGNDAWSIHKGNCGFGYISEDQPAGWDVVALSDQFPQYSGSCGRCYEVKCNPTVVKDGYGKTFDRTEVCFDPSTSLLVRVVDSCPCSYPSNWYSNKRWCCGDMDHMDISVWAFEKLADKKWGVIGIQYRPVPCNYVPSNPAPKAAQPTPGQYWSNQPNFMNDGNLKTPKIWNGQQTSTMVQGWSFGDPTGSSSSTKASASPSSSSSATSSSSSSSSSASASSYSSSSYSATASASSSDSRSSASTSAFSSGGSFGVHGFSGQPDSSNAGASDASVGSGVIFKEQLQNGWQEASYSAKINWQAGLFGASGGNAVCGEVYGGGALAVKHAKGAFQNIEVLEWWVKTDGGKPALSINLGGGSKYCSPLSMPSLQVLSTSGSWSRLAVHLGDFGGSYTSFKGCGGNDLYDLTTVEFKNSGGGTQKVCLDGIQLLSTVKDSS